MLKLLKSTKGITITEVIMALAVLGILSVPILAVFSNAVFITKLTGTQMEINTVVQIAKGEVTQSVKYNHGLVVFDDPVSEIRINPTAVPKDSLYSAMGNETEFLRLQTGNLTEKYKYKVKYINKGQDTFGTIAPEAGTNPEPRTVELEINMYTFGGKFIRQLKTFIAY